MNIKGVNSLPRRGGFTLIELVVVIVVVSTLVGVAIDKLLYYQERAEKAVLDATLESVKMGLRIRMAELIVSNRTSELPQLERENPMQWLSEPPASYAGVDTAAKPGNWFYATKEKELAYVPKSSSYLEGGQISGQRDKTELRFKVELRYQAPTEGGGRAIVGITLVPTRAYKWFQM